MKYFLTIIFISTLSLGCGYDGSWRDGPYVVWTQESNERVLDREIEDDKGSKGGIGLVDSIIIAVGSDNLYVVAKRKNPVSKVISYYYIEKNKDDGRYISFKKMTHGPFDKTEFIKLQKKLGLPAFTKVFSE